MSAFSSFLSPNFFQRGLLDAVQSASSMEELLIMLKCLPLCELKALLTTKINTIKTEQPDQLRSVYYNALSINAVLPTDVIQRILSFDGMYHSNVVCKKWKLLSKKNETNYLKQIYKNVPVIPNDSITFIAHPKRRYLHPVEEALGYKRPMHIMDILESHKYGGYRILVHDGIYNIDATADPIDIGGIQMIGLGNNAVFLCNSELSPMMFWAEIDPGDTVRKIHIENIMFRYIDLHHRAHCISLSGYSSAFTLKNCTFRAFGGSGFDMNSAASVKHLNVIDCKFIDMKTALYLGGKVNATVKNCLFQRCGGTYHQPGVIRMNEHPIMIAEKPQHGDDSEYVFDNNIFENCNEAIVESLHILFHSTYLVLEDHLHQYVFMNNMLKITSTDGSDTVQDLNRIMKIDR